jgi:hypothetical protein
MSSELEEAADMAVERIREEMDGEGGSRDGLTKWVALSTMVMALLSALGALMAGITANEVMVERTTELLQTSEESADRLDVEMLRSKHAILVSLGEVPDPGEAARIAGYEADQEALAAETSGEESEVGTSLAAHERFALGVTLLSVAITLSGVTLVTKRKAAWGVGLSAAAVGVAFLAAGMFMAMG